MPTLVLRFPAGRYHATPWGHHVNEGLVEWPPSPWRLLRALIATGFATEGWTAVPPAGVRLVESLAGVLPRYRLPPGTVAHSRHYMPLAVLDKGRERTTLVFDTWADVGAGELAVRWECALDAEANELFERLVPRLGYLGRSESWVLATAVSDGAELAAGIDAYPHVDGHRPGRGWEQVSLMAADAPDAYGAWREQAVGAALEAYPLPLGKRASKSLLNKRAKAIEPYPPDLIDCLQRDTAWWKQFGWSQPPGSRRVLYWRRSDGLAVSPPSASAPTKPHHVRAVLFALTPPSGSRSALPSRARALPQAELLHRAAIGLACRGDRNCAELTGKDDGGRPLSGHQHAHILPLDLDGDDRLDHILVHAPRSEGLGIEAQQALRRLKRTWTKGGVGELQLAIAGIGELDDLRSLDAPLNGGVTELLGPQGGATVWESFTPFVPPRYPKRRGSNSIAGQVQTELTTRGYPSATVECLPWDDSTRGLRHAIRVRRHPAKPPPVDAGFAIRIEFESPVSGPISLGYASHFGLGLFVSR